MAHGPLNLSPKTSVSASTGLRTLPYVVRMTLDGIKAPKLQRLPWIIRVVLFVILGPAKGWGRPRVRSEQGDVMEAEAEGEMGGCRKGL